MFQVACTPFSLQGAAECVLERCTKVLLNTGLTVPLGEETRAQVLAAVDRITSRGLRCLAFGIKTNLGGQLWSLFDRKAVHEAERVGGMMSVWG